MQINKLFKAADWRGAGLCAALLLFACSSVQGATSNLLDPDADLKSVLDDRTHVVFLGTGTPVPDAQRAGASVAVIYNHRAYLFDLGAGAVRRAAEAAQTLGIDELDPPRIEHVFFTHLHSDHTLDYSTLAFTLWWRRGGRLKAWGPQGLASITEGIYAMMARDIEIRNNDSQPVLDPQGYQVAVTEIEPGLVYEDGPFQVFAFPAPHGEVRPAYSYKVVAPDRTIVISGDTSYSEELIRQAQGADILIHETISEAGLSNLSEFWQNYHNQSHTPTSRLGELASRAQPGLLVLYHVLFYGEDAKSVLGEVREHYQGPVRLANDLDIF